jgi:hypothetical protein
MRWKINVNLYQVVKVAQRQIAGVDVPVATGKTQQNQTCYCICRFAEL